MSFVVESDPAQDVTRPVDGDQGIGIDLGLTRFAVLADGTHIASPTYLRRAERKLKNRQRELSRKEKGSSNRDKARIKVARAHAKAADSRRNLPAVLDMRSAAYGRAIERTRRWRLSWRVRCGVVL